MPEGLTDRQWKWILLRHPSRQQLWLYYPAARVGDFEVLRVCDRTGWDAAVLSWHTCSGCRRGHIAKISIADRWQRKGLGRRLVLRDARRAGLVPRPRQGAATVGMAAGSPPLGAVGLVAG